MLCSHDWIFDTPCPKCGVAAAVTPEATPSETDPPAEIDTSIPDFLKRNPDNTFVHPETSFPELQRPPALIVRDAFKSPWQMDEAELRQVVGSHMHVVDKQPYYRELHTRTERSRARDRRLDKEAKETKPERHAWEKKPKELTRKSRTRNSPRA